MELGVLVSHTNVAEEWAEDDAEKNPDVCVGAASAWEALRKLRAQNPAACEATDWKLGRSFYPGDAGSPLPCG